MRSLLRTGYHRSLLGSTALSSAPAPGDPIEVSQMSTFAFFEPSEQHVSQVSTFAFFEPV